MLYILLSILSSTLIVLIFKLTERFNIPIFQIVVLNYFSAFSLGFFLNDTEISTKMLFEQPWMPFAVLIGTGFIIMFFLMGKAARNSGVTATTVAGKMSVALPVLFSMLFYSEEITLYKIGGIVLALLGVVLMVYKPINGVSAKKIDLLPFVLFVGAGTLDIGIKYTQNAFVDNETSAIFSSALFASAAVIGGITAFFNPFKFKSYLQPKILFSGLLLGAANFGSLYFMILALNSKVFDSSIIFGMNNTSVVLLAAVSAYILFAEKQSKLNIAGILISTLAVVLLSIA
ncbi:MAG TPA: hypothetical protein DCQ31_01185 [Bacteroidales bacterium]|nr:hypothetical protein [Bacteroidales bacterium]